MSSEKEPLLHQSAQHASCSRRFKCGSAFLVLGALVLSIIIIVLAVTSNNDDADIVVKETNDSTASAYFKMAAVASDAPACSTIGKDLLSRGGSAVDAAIGSMLCVGVYNMQSTGIGGSSFMLIYEKPRNGTKKELTALNFREQAPEKSAKNMFLKITPDVDPKALEIAVFGEIAGYWTAWQRYGRLPWTELFQPTIDICEEGFEIRPAFGDILCCGFQEDAAQNIGNMKNIYFKDDGTPYKTGDLLKLPELGATLKAIAKGGAYEFYRGNLSKVIIEDLKELGSIITAEDLANYKATWEDPMILPLSSKKVRLATLGAPSGGPVLQYIVRLMDRISWEKYDKPQKYHIVGEIFKFAYALKTRLGDPKFINVTGIIQDIKRDEFIAETIQRIDLNRTHDIDYYEPDIGFSDDEGTSHLSVYTEDGAAVSLTSSINAVMGNSRRGRRTGILFNNGMDDFATSEKSNTWELPPSKANQIDPHKQPLSSMSPSILFDSQGEVKAVVGGAGGSKIITSIANTLYRFLYNNEDIAQSVTSPRTHHQLSPNRYDIERPLYDELCESLTSKGHEVNPKDDIAVVQAIARMCDENKENCGLLAVSDIRKGGIPDGY